MRRDRTRRRRHEVAAPQKAAKSTSWRLFGVDRGSEAYIGSIEPNLAQLVAAARVHSTRHCAPPRCDARESRSPATLIAPGTEGQRFESSRARYKTRQIVCICRDFVSGVRVAFGGSEARERFRASFWRVFGEFAKAHASYTPPGGEEASSVTAGGGGRGPAGANVQAARTIRVQAARTIRCDRLPRRGGRGRPQGSLAPCRSADGESAGSTPSYSAPFGRGSGHPADARSVRRAAPGAGFHVSATGGRETSLRFPRQLVYPMQARFCWAMRRVTTAAGRHWAARGYCFATRGHLCARGTGRSAMGRRDTNVALVRESPPRSHRDTFRTMRNGRLQRRPPP
jgi:hypothetical protein